jgi:tRNA dimethylallyltransferase
MKQATALCLAGPTASGKSAAAIELAQRLKAEIISVDSMQVYRGMDVGTAKPSAPDRARVRHHLIDIVDPAHPFDAAQFTGLARQALMDITSRGVNTIFCGGTGLYFKALLNGLGQSPPSMPSLRAGLEKVPLPELLAQLEALDPATYKKIDRQNPRRVIRALEVIRISSRPFSELRSDWSAGQGASGAGGREFPQLQLVFFGLSRSREDLVRRIDQRVDWMFGHGLVSETEALLERGLATNTTAGQALGYRQVMEHLNGLRPLQETIALVKVRTRQYAKRQLTWFRNQGQLEWIDVAPEEPAQQLAGRIASRYSELISHSPF